MGSAVESPGRGESIAHAYEQLRELIVRGRLAPGSRIVESEIADRLGVSRTPARSALHRLQQEGYVTGGGIGGGIDRARDRRLVVAPLTQSDGRELFHIVGGVEGLAAREAASLPTAERAALTARLRELNAAFAAVSRAPRPSSAALFDTDAAFHRAYVEAGAGPRVLALHDAIRPQAERYAWLYAVMLFDEIATSVAEHDVIVRHVERGDVDGAQRAVETNWRNAATRLASVIDAQGERGSW